MLLMSDPPFRIPLWGTVKDVSDNNWPYLAPLNQEIRRALQGVLRGGGRQWVPASRPSREVSRKGTNGVGTNGVTGLARAGQGGARLGSPKSSKYLNCLLHIYIYIYIYIHII